MSDKIKTFGDYESEGSVWITMHRKFPQYRIKGPERAGKDILLGDVFPDYPNPRRPVDLSWCVKSEEPYHINAIIRRKKMFPDAYQWR